MTGHLALLVLTALPAPATAAAGWPSAASATAQADSAIVLDVPDEYFAAYAARAADFDYPGARHDRLPDNSLYPLGALREAVQRWIRDKRNEP